MNQSNADQTKMSTHNKKKILHVTPFYPPSKGGISYVVKNLSSALEYYDNEIFILTTMDSRGDIHGETNKNLVRIKSIYMPGWPYSTLRNFSIPMDMGFKVNEVIKNGKFDLVHVHGHHYPLSWLAIRSADKHSVPVVLSLHGMYALNPRVLGGKTVMENLFNRSIFSYILSKCTAVIGGTSQIMEYAEKYAKSTTRFSIIANGVNTSKFRENLIYKKQFRINYKITDNKIVILFVGRFEEVKGVIEFSQAAKLLARHDKNLEIIIVGEGKLLPNIKSITKDLENIRILDWLSPEKIHELYIASDIFVLPSKFEALPLAIIEAMNANLFIIHSPVGGVEDILKGYNKKTKLPNITAQDIFDRVLSVIYSKSFNDIDLLSIEYANTFDWLRVANETNKLYEDIRNKRWSNPKPP
jgi:glycosyltransferase involved in cell wall biosynthesis